MKRRSTRRLAVIAVGFLVAVAVAACGGSSSPQASTSSTSTSGAPAAAAPGAPAGAGSARRAALTACLKKYGVTLPTAGGGFGGRRFGATGATGAFRRLGATGRAGRVFGATGSAGGPGGGLPGAGGFAANPKFAAAIAKCGGFGGGFGGRFGAGGATGARGFARASSPQYRAEVTSYAACMTSHGVALPKPNFSGTGFVFGANVNRTTSAFIAANAKCVGLLSAAAGGGTTSAG
jgi:hypothetical protein